MFNGFGKTIDSVKEGMEKAPQMPEPSSKNPSIDSLRERLAEIFPIPCDMGNKEQKQNTGELHPKEITLNDGTVITFPDPILYSTETGASMDANGSYMTVEGNYIPNNTYELSGTVYKTDDCGEIYSSDGKLYPNDTYELNGNVYETDENGRIIVVQAEPTLAPENPRDNDAQKNAGGKDRQEGDQGGHIVGRDMGGDGGEGNLVAMDSKINQSDYKRMENDIKRALTDEKDVAMYTEISYSGDSERPDIIEVSVTVDGKEIVYKYDNNLNGALRARIEQTGGKDATEATQSVLDETDGEVSSIKEEYDEDGSLVKVTVNITYISEDGKTQRTKVVIDNPRGGN